MFPGKWYDETVVGERFGTSVTLSSEWTIVEKLDKPKHQGGICVLRCTAKNQHGDVVLEADGKILISSRPASRASGA